MCGIVGLITPKGTKPSKLDAFLLQALFCDTLRGTDGTGMFVVNGNKPASQAEVFKRALPAPDYLQLKPAQRLLQEAGYANTVAAIGHNRAATKGTVAHDNAHPFVQDHITLVHNGTLINRHTLKVPRADFDVDSESVAFNMARHGPEGTIPFIHGSFALVWHDAERGTVNLVRNEQRPLAVALLDDGKGYALASESLMLKWLLTRNHIDFDKTIWTYKPGMMATFSWSKKGKVSVETTQLKLYEPKVYDLGGNQSRSSGNFPPQRPYHSTQPASQTTPPLASKLKGQIKEASKSSSPITQARTFGESTFEALGWQRGQTVLAYYNEPGAITGGGISQGVKLMGYCNNADAFVGVLCSGVAPVTVQQWEQIKESYPAALITLDHAYEQVADGNERDFRVVGKLFRMLNNDELKKFESMEFPGSLETIEVKSPSEARKKSQPKPPEPEAEAKKEFVIPDTSRPWWEDEDGNVFVKGPDEKFFTLRDWKELVAGGCVAGCSTVFTRSDANNIHWLHNWPFCHECFNDKEITDSIGMTMQ